MSTGRAHRHSLRRRCSRRNAPASPCPNGAGRRPPLVRHAVAAALTGLLALAAGIPAAGAAACCPGELRSWKACEVLKPIGSSLTVRFPEDTSWASLAFGSIQLEDAARSLRRPNRALVAFADDNGVRTLTALGVRMDRRIRILAVLLVTGSFLLAASALTTGRLRQLGLGQDNRYSNSKCQMLLWFGVLVVSYLATILLRWWAGGGQYAGAVGVPNNLLLLSGLSALTFVGAKALTQGKEDRAEALSREQPALARDLPRKGRALRPSFPGDLVNDDHGDTDFGDFQMIVVTLLAVVVYGVRVFTCLGRIELACASTLPDVDTTILGAFALGQGAYLAKKAASRPGEG